MSISPDYTHFIGWDVGGWNCDKNEKSRDAMVVLDASGQFVGKIKWGNVAQSIQHSDTASDWIKHQLRQCTNAADIPETFHALLAIDAPLGFPQALSNLMSGESRPCLNTKHGFNPYLFRYTETELYQRGIASPLSAVKDMIGSQATKAMHMIAKFRLKRVSTGVWQDCFVQPCLTVIETYPAAFVANNPFINLTERFATVGIQDWNKDEIDALHCAWVARLFATERASFRNPTQEVPDSEGWIWFPEDNSRLVTESLTATLDA
jgi:predicted nuclease with RNAse H fold